jgi:hypothetical protein
MPDRRTALVPINQRTFLRTTVLLIAGVMLTACTSEPKPGSSEWLEGTWTTEPARKGPITFEPDGSAHMDRIKLEDLNLTWALSGQTLSMTQEGRDLPDALLSDITKNSFTGERPFGRLIRFTRAPDLAIGDLKTTGDE